ncbi:MAG: hypothetical protein COV59_03740 [Candidatus Magasanikbacteria bacterium CG11_big_fil_rev_8_21_14_0_20_39_34]|uniref:Glycosyl transferase family 1 domain-containing protein n=1 Tax=Candidatus Magasanikbacteria bacterium CG11_big_fil_rev_8_21_14_0_20_39_34 TaxID=1974653 RepID=A0A2H0N4D0_9BACT|nr:MAG: hypothetical protein COV59_03740 [Candidatus Magasanikbacteria bacterium CG11_big_fil_rev_8_21_14_0_20_39_34]
MNLLYISNARLPTEKAHGVQIMNMSSSFSKLFDEVTLLLPWRNNKIKGDPFLYYGIKKTFSIRKVPSLDLIFLGKIGFYIQMFSFSFWSSLFVLFSRQNVIYGRDPFILLFATFLHKNVFWEAHTQKNNFFIKSLLRRCKGVVCISSGLKEYFIQNGLSQEKALVEPDAVDEKIFDIALSKEEARSTLSLPSNRIILGYIGKFQTMGKEKGVKEIIEAFSVIVRAYPETFLLLVGAQPQEKKVFEEYAFALGIPKIDFHIEEHKKQSEIPVYLKACDILIMNYPYTEHYAKFMSPLKLFEYMISKRIIVTSDLPSLREVIGDNEAVFFQDSPNKDKLQMALDSILQNISSYANMAENAYQKVQSYTWDKRAKRIFHFIKKI